MRTYIALIDLEERCAEYRESVLRGIDPGDAFLAEEEIEVEARDDAEAWRLAREVLAADYQPGIDVLRVFPA